MELWVLFAVISALASGGYSFCLKIAAVHNYSTARIFLYASLIGFGAAALYSVIFLPNFSAWKTILFLAVINSLTYYCAIVMRVESLKNIHTTIYFPIYKTLGPILATIVGIYYFRDTLGPFEMLGIALGVIVPLFLLSKSEHAIQKNIPKGLRLLVYGALLTTVTAATGKYIVQNNFDIVTFVFFAMAMHVLIAGMMVYRQRSSTTHGRTQGIARIAIITGIIHITSFVFFTIALQGDFSVVYTINAFSILVPIVLSVWWFKEHMNLRKAIVIFLSIVSVVFFAL